MAGRIADAAVSIGILNEEKPAPTHLCARRVSCSSPTYGVLVDVVVDVLEELGALPLWLSLELLAAAPLLDVLLGTGTGTVVVLFVVVFVELEGDGVGTTVVVLLLGGLLIVVCEIVVGGFAAVL